MSFPSLTKTILFLGATGGCGLSVLRRSLAAGHTCIALVRNPAKLTNLLPADLRSLPTLRLLKGSATDVPAIAGGLVHTPPGAPPALVDTIIFAVGGAFDWTKFANDQPTICGDAMTALLSALACVRAESPSLAAAVPRIAAVSTTGIPASGVRDVPLLFLPMYQYMLKQPHEDKKVLEKALIESEGTRWTLVRPSFLTDGKEKGELKVGIEDPKTGRLEKSAVGYTISREDVGKWIFEEIIEKDGREFAGKAVTITH